SKHLLHPAVAGARVAHFSGITAALSPSCLQLTRHAILERVLAPAIISFDINFRQALWSRAVAAPILAELADASDIVFVGLDEAALLWGCETAAEVRATLPNAGSVVVKNDAHGAESFGLTGQAFTPAPQVHVVEPVGAGDAFAAGYISGLLRDFDEEQRLRLGHLVAAQALSVTSDHAPVPPFDWFRHHLELSSDEWGRLVLDLDRMAAK